jgi:hypothetical protein
MAGEGARLHRTSSWRTGVSALHQRQATTIWFARIVRNPDPGQSSPSVFFSATCSAISSARTSSLVWIGKYILDTRAQSAYIFFL